MPCVNLDFSQVRTAKQERKMIFTTPRIIGFTKNMMIAAIKMKTIVVLSWFRFTSIGIAAILAIIVSFLDLLHHFLSVR